MSIVVCKLPKAGLGNQLFPLLKGYTFAHLNSLPVVVTGYNQVFIGPYLRREKSKRNYRGIFVFQKNILVAGLNQLKLLAYKKFMRVTDPAVKKMEGPVDDNRLYVFTEMPHWDHYFDGLRENRAYVIDTLWKLILPQLRQQVNAMRPPVIGVHIRMGDFRKLRDGETFGDAGAVRTPENYFIDIINAIRTIHGTDLPVSVFTDGYPQELEQLLSLTNIELVTGNTDMADLLLLSRSKIMITSAGSTFSYWAAFLSDAAIIMHPRHTGTIIRPAETGNKLYHGAWDPGNMLLLETISRIERNS